MDCLDRWLVSFPAGPEIFSHRWTQGVFLALVCACLAFYCRKSLNFLRRGLRPAEAAADPI